jgi:hypothetical protein
VAVLGSETFDVFQVDPTTLAFGPEGTSPTPSAASRRDVNGNGYADLVSRYPTAETGIAFGDTEACVTGATLAGRPFKGCDSITTVPPAAPASRWRSSSHR